MKTPDWQWLADDILESLHGRIVNINFFENVIMAGKNIVDTASDSHLWVATIRNFWDFLNKGLASQCKAQEKYKERLDSGVTWLKWLPTGMESKTRLAPKSNKVNSHKLTLNWNTSLYYRVVWKWRQSAFHANNHAIGGGSNGIIIHLWLNPRFEL